MTKERTSNIWQLVLLGGLFLIGVLLMLFGDSFGAAGTAADSERDWESYIFSLEEKAGRLCSQVAGISDVTVAVSLSQGVEYVYADGEDGYGGREAVLLTERPPQISGIGVVCRGADDPRVKETLIGLLSAAFGVGSHRIYITAAG